jgi:predicted hotdog family 3-hydroxylacyl-ACP dehydratase
VSAALPAAAVPQALAGEALLAILPHRTPILLLESVPWLEADRAVGLTRPLGLERTGVPRPGDGTVPELLMVEAVAQLAAVAVIVAARAEDPSRHAEPQPGLLAAVPEFRFSGTAPVGARLALWVELERRLGRIVTARGEVYAGARLVGAGRVTIAIGAA